MRGRAAAATAAVLLVALSPLAASAHHETLPTNQAPLTGRVLTKSGNPVAGACVSAFPYRGSGRHDEGRTDSHGRFLLHLSNAEKDDTLAFVVRVHPCVSSAPVAPEWAHATNGYEGSAFVGVTRGRMNQRNFVLRTESRLFGTLTGPDGQPLVGVRVETAQWSEDRGTGAEEVVADRTDASGRFELRQLVPGPHKVRAYGPGGVLIAVSGGPAFLAQGGQAVVVGEGKAAEVRLRVL